MAENARVKQEQKKLMAEKLWLNYFNQSLYEKGFLTEGQRNRLKLMIDSRKPSAQRTGNPPAVKTQHIDSWHSPFITQRKYPS